MPYIGQPPVSGDTTKSFRLLDNLASFTLTFDATSSSVVDTTANTLTFANHRFVTAQRVTYTDGGGTAIGGLTDGTAYFVIKVDQNTIQLASSASNANNSTAISLSAGAAGGSHTLNIAFDGTNTKFKVTYGNGTKAKISRAGQLLISINGVLQQAQESSTPTLGFGLDSDSTIVFSQAPVSTDVLFGQILADTIANFDTQDNTLDVFTGDGSTTGFTLSKKPASNNDILVTLDGVVQYPTTTSTSNAYSVAENTLTFTSAPANGVAIQVRHIGFAGATSSAVTGLYGRTGNVTLSSSDDDITVGNVTAGIITATSYGSISGTTASFSGNVSIGGTLTYEDVTNIDSVGLITARSGISITSGDLTLPDSIIHAGDTNTKIRFPAADTFTVETGGSEALRIDSSGRLLIGTTTPGDSSADDLTISTSGHSGISIKSGTSHAGGIYFGDGTSGSSQYEGIIQYSHTVNALQFYTNYSGGSDTRMMIDSSGRLLIGTTTEGNSAADNLTVADSAACGISIRSGTSANGALYFSDGTSGNDEFRGYIIYEHNTNALRFATDATERLRVDSSGRLLIGTSSSRDVGQSTAGLFQVEATDSTALVSITRNANGVQGPVLALGKSRGTSNGSNTVVQSGDNLGLIYFAGADGTDTQTVAGRIQCQVDGTPGSNDMPGRLLFSTTADGASSPTERLRITSTGFVGIGEDSPDSLLHIGKGTNTDDGVVTFTIGGSVANTRQSSITKNNVGSSDRALEIRAATGSSDETIKFFSDSTTERMRLDSDGRLMLGTTTEGYAGAELFTIASSGNAGITIRTGTTSNGTLAFSDATSGTAEYDGYIQYRHNTQDLVLATDGEERARFSSGGAFLLVPNTNVDTIYSSVASTGTSAAVFRGLHSATVGTPGSGTDSIFIFANGNIQNTNNSYGQISDIKLKENIVDAGSQWSDFKSVRFRKYNFKSETGHETNTQLGVVAQELELTSPGLVYETVDRDIDGNDLGTKTKGVKSSILTMKALVALQEAMARIETLETQNADLLSRVAALEG